MFFQTASECSQYAKDLGLNVDPALELVVRPDSLLPTVKINYENSRVSRYAIAKQMAFWFDAMHNCLLWVTEWGIWPSWENMHLYYKLRQSYKDHRPLKNVSSHLFFDYESADLTTYLHFALEAQWGGFLFGTPNPTHVFFSHDGWMLVGDGSGSDAVFGWAKDVGLPCERENR